MEKIYKKDINKVMPILQALAEGKTIQFETAVNKWVDLDGDEDGLLLETLINSPQSYRIKPEPKSKYRPFKNAEECWNEMQKHQPIGYTKLIGETEYSFITDVDNTINYSDAMKEYTFADGTPFGIKEEEQLWRGQQYVNLVWSVYLMQNQ